MMGIKVPSLRREAPRRSTYIRCPWFASSISSKPPRHVGNGAVADRRRLSLAFAGANGQTIAAHGAMPALPPLSSALILAFWIFGAFTVRPINWLRWFTGG